MKDMLVAVAGSEEALAERPIAVFDACPSEIIGMAKRLVAGIDGRQTPIALDIIRDLGHDTEYLSHPQTLRWFREEFYIPSEVIDRDTLEAWEKKGAKSTWERARDRVDSLLAQYQPSPIADEVRKELRELTTHAANRAGMERLPDLSF